MKTISKISSQLFTLCIIGLMTACSTPAPKKNKVRPVKSIIIGSYIDGTGKGFPAVTAEKEESDISFRVGGPILKSNIIEGGRVKKGSLIAQVDPRDYVVKVKATEARYNQTKAESDRFYRLWKKGSVAKNDYERRFATYLEAEAAWEDAKNALADTKIYAPYAGYFGKKLANIGEEVRPKQSITTLVDLSVIEVNTTIPEQLAVQLLNFNDYTVTFETYPGKVFKATLKELEKKPTAEGYPLHLFLSHTNTRKDPVKISTGMSCKVNIEMKKTDDNKGKIIIPISAIFESNTENLPAVWVIDPESKTVSKKVVTVGALQGNDAIEITEGITLGQQIVTAGVYRLTEGTKVNILDAK